jgi:phosphoribosyl-AMP cyclohydrolase
MSEPFPAPGPAAELERGRTIMPRFDASGLITAVAQHAQTLEVVMVAHMNAEALRLSLETGEAHYWSRARQALWRKGETSGQIQRIVEMRVDCDQDAVVLKVIPGGDGGVCHTGEKSCFYRVVEGGELVPLAAG